MGEGEGRDSERERRGEREREEEVEGRERCIVLTLPEAADGKVKGVI